MIFHAIQLFNFYDVFMRRIPLVRTIYDWNARGKDAMSLGGRVTTLIKCWVQTCPQTWTIRTRSDFTTGFSQWEGEFHETRIGNLVWWLCQTMERLPKSSVTLRKMMHWTVGSLAVPIWFDDPSLGIVASQNRRNSGSWFANIAPSMAASLYESTVGKGHIYAARMESQISLLKSSTRFPPTKMPSVWAKLLSQFEALIEVTTRGDQTEVKVDLLVDLIGKNPLAACVCWVGNIVYFIL